MKIFDGKIFSSWILVIAFFLFLFFFVINKQDIWTSDVQVKDNQINSLQENNLNFNKIQYVKIAGKILKVDLALTSEAQEQGLSGRKELKEDEGMLFVFDYMGQYSFWMKNMNFPIDIIWISDDFKVVYIKKNATPESYPETFLPDQNTKYVLEVSAGFSEKNNLKVGDKVEFLSP